MTAVLFLLAVVLLAPGAAVHAHDFATQRRQILDLGGLTAPPAMQPAEGFPVDGGLRAISNDALPWKGQPTKVFAWLGLPAHATAKVPGLVLVHGGGGSAFKEWVRRWNDRGFAAISIFVEGQTDATVIGIDDRFAFAIPMYGCGGLSTSANQYGAALGTNALYREAWDPLVRMHRVRMPVLWFSWPQDAHFPLDRQAACYRAAAGPHMVSLVPGLGHGHDFKAPQGYAFAESVTTPLPAGTTAWFVNVHAGELVASSDYQERER